MNYYFTESKWYGPIKSLDFNSIEDGIDYFSSLPSGPSLIPQFAGMVKEEGKDFRFEELYERYKTEPIKTAVPVADEFKYLNERAKNIPEETRLEVSKMMDKLDAEEGFNKDEMQKVQDDIDSVMKGKIVDKAKLIGISAISNDELCDIVQNACQLINGFKPDAVEGNYWSDWDESVLQSLIEILRRTQPAYGKEEGKQTFSEEKRREIYFREDMTGFAEYCADQTDFMRTEDGVWKSFDEQKACNTEYLLFEYLKTKQ